jgi:hypothetical protein
MLTLVSRVMSRNNIRKLPLKPLMCIDKGAAEIVIVLVPKFRDIEE